MTEISYERKENLKFHIAISEGFKCDMKNSDIYLKKFNNMMLLWNSKNKYYTP